MKKKLRQKLQVTFNQSQFAKRKRCDRLGLLFCDILIFSQQKSSILNISNELKQCSATYCFVSN